MAGKIEDYALIGDLHGAALVCRDGSIDWLCVPRFDSPACFAALLGDDENGFWRIQPHGLKSSRRRYRPDTLILETEFEADGGSAELIDFMPVRQGRRPTSLIRLVRGKKGRVRMSMELAMRFDYGRTVPWVRKRDYGLTALSGPHTLELRSPVQLQNREFRTRAEFTVNEGEVVPFSLTYRNIVDDPLEAFEAERLCEQVEGWWRDWSAKCRYEGPWRDAVMRSLITLKALTHLPTGGLVAAPTTSLPETLGGERNWDYRFCWLRDATFTLYAMLTSGLDEEAVRWRDWLLRVAAGKPSQLQTIYSPTGERLLPEIDIAWLSGYEGAKPVRAGNQAHTQLQLDVYGEIMDVFHTSRRQGLQDTDDSWGLQEQLVGFLESGWRQPDNGIWEVRGPRRHFTHSKVMAWVAVDRAIKAVESSRLEGPLDHWKQLRQEIHAEVCSRGFDSELNAFVQHYGSKALDASLLMIPLVGFLPPDDPRCRGTVAAIERELTDSGFVLRYTPNAEVEGVHGREGAFLPCTFWLADNYAIRGEHERAAKLFQRLLGLCNDVGLLSEEFDTRAQRQCGNFPQAFSHVCLINTAHNLSRARPAQARSQG